MLPKESIHVWICVLVCAQTSYPQLFYVGFPCPWLHQRVATGDCSPCSPLAAGCSRTPGLSPARCTLVMTCLSCWPSASQSRLTDMWPGAEYLHRRKVRKRCRAHCQVELTKAAIGGSYGVWLEQSSCSISRPSCVWTSDMGRYAHLLGKSNVISAWCRE